MMENLFDLSGRVAAITGSSRGIGQSIAIALAETGADIVLIQRSVRDRKTMEKIEGLGRRCDVVECDMHNLDMVKSVIGKSVAVFGRLDILVNNAGIQYIKEALEFPLEIWDEIMLLNLRSLFILCQDAGKYMINHGGGKIINIASLMSFIAGEKIPAYSASKGGVAQLTKALSNEWARFGVNVNAIAPGFIATDMNPGMENNNELVKSIPRRRIGRADDIKGCAVFLASQASDYVCGHILVVDGGVLCN
jgi:2-deoxy-D-gluconate 3-dehydrogenase